MAASFKPQGLSTRHTMLHDVTLRLLIQSTLLDILSPWKRDSRTAIGVVQEPSPPCPLGSVCSKIADRSVQQEGRFSPTFGQVRLSCLFRAPILPLSTGSLGEHK
jgi:hypothetical protein